MKGFLIALAYVGLVIVAALSTKPAKSQQFGGTTYCNSSVVFDSTPSSAATRLVASSAGQSGGSIYICGYVVASLNTVAAGLVYGTGTACATGTTAISPVYQFKAATAGSAPISDPGSNYRGMSVPAGNDLCINVTPISQSIQAIVYYYQAR